MSRGGAGNLQWRKGIEEVKKSMPNKSTDIEAQKQALAVDQPPSDPSDVPADPAAVPVSSATSTATTGPIWARSGRGGAYNFHTVDPAAIRSHAEPSPATVHSAAGVRKPGMVPRLGGRGGAGNFASGEGEKAYNEEQERKRKAALDAKVFDDVTNKLPTPGRVYHMHGHGQGSRKIGEPEMYDI